MARKSLTSFVCQECGYDSPKFMGKCPECGQWNSFKEIRNVSVSSKSALSFDQTQNITPQPLGAITAKEKNRMSTTFSEMDGVLGGGIVGGSVILLAGDPGIGKSTLLLQTALQIANTNGKVLYISAEESVEQVTLRARRISSKHSQDFLLLSLTDTDVAALSISQTKPSLVIIDSIQAFASENAGGFSGAVSQIRYATAVFVKLAKTLGIPFVIVGHVTKEGMVAGPMVLSHMVDVVLFLEGEKATGTRILRSLKNRFGPVDEVGVFEMQGIGMQEVKNPTEHFLDSKDQNTPGSVLITTLEGTRAFLVELQALVITSRLPMPRRVASGVDAKRLELLLAVLQKHCRLPFDTMDVFVNVAGGLKIVDPAIDLGICLALLSSLKNIPLSRTVAIGEVGLLGELRMVPFLAKRTKQAKKLGFAKIISADQYTTLLQAIEVVQ